MIMVISTAADGILPSGPVGQLPIASGGSFTASIVAVNAVGTQVGPTLNFACALNPGDQNQSVDVVDVLQDPGPTGSTGPTQPTGTSRPPPRADYRDFVRNVACTATATSAPRRARPPSPAPPRRPRPVYREAKAKLVGKAQGRGRPRAREVTGDGQARAQAQRGEAQDRALVELNDLGKAKKVFKNITKAGTYNVVARYLGSPTLARSSDPKVSCVTV